MCPVAAQATVAVAAIRLTLAEIVRTHGDAYRRTHRLATVQALAWRAIAACRTALLGGRRETCDHCGATRLTYNSCLMGSASFWGADGNRSGRNEASRPLDSPLPWGLEPGEQCVRRSERSLAQARRHDGLDRLQLLTGIGADVHLRGGQLAVAEPE